MPHFLPAGCVALLAFAASTVAQCEPGWETTIGNPGVAGGYVGTIVPWNDGSAERLYAGGSFTSAGGNAAADYVARWSPSTNTWNALSTGIWNGFTNAFVNAITPFDPGDGKGERLVVGGWFARAGTAINTASLAMWNGSAWEEMGTGWYVASLSDSRRGAVWAIAPWQGRLYVGGGLFPAGASIPACALASWDGAAWAPIATALPSISANPGIFALLAHDDGTGEKLYVAGRFDSIDGTPGTFGIARWTGAAWESLGPALIPFSSFAAVNVLEVFDDGSGPALYAGVVGLRVPGQAQPGGFLNTQVIKWNGASWSPVGDWVGTGAIQALRVFDDGTGRALYLGGQALPDIKYVARFVGGAWQTLGGGFTAVAPPWPGVFGLGVWEDRLYVGGTFSPADLGPSAHSIVAWRGCPSCYADCEEDGDLDVFDYLCFLGLFANQDPYADCEGDGDWDIFDFLCYQGKYSNGCD